MSDLAARAGELPRLATGPANRVPGAAPGGTGELPGVAASRPGEPQAAADRTNEPPEGAAERPAEPATAETFPESFPESFPETFPESGAGPKRLALRDAVRQAQNPLDTPLLRALGRDPDLVLPVARLRPEAWPLAQHLADPEGRPIDGQGPYRRVPHLPYGEWLANQHLLPLLDHPADAPPNDRETPPAHTPNPTPTDRAA